MCAGLGVAVILPIRQWTLGNPISLGFSAIFSSLSRIGWAGMLTWIVISCQSGYGGPINTFMSWSGWLPLGRLSYCAYLLHLMVYVQFAKLYPSGIVFTSLSQIVSFIARA